MEIRHDIIHRGGERGSPAEEVQQAPPSIEMKVADVGAGSVKELKEGYSTEAAADLKKTHAWKEVREMIGGFIEMGADKVKAAVGKFFGSKPQAAVRDANQNALFGAVFFPDTHASIEDFKPKGEASHSEAAAHAMKCCVVAMKTTLPETLNNEKLQNKLQEGLAKVCEGIDNPDDLKKMPKQIQKCFEKVIKSYCEKNGLSEEKVLGQFRLEVAETRVADLPATMTSEFEVKIGDKNVLVSETTTGIPADIAAKYLEKAGGENYRSHIDFINRHKGENGEWRQRPSAAREQGFPCMIYNAAKHSAKSNNGEIPDEIVLRSGAFAVHGQGKIGLTKLKEMEAELKRIKDDLKSEESPGKIEKLKMHREKILIKLAKNWGITDKNGIVGSEALKLAETKLAEQITDRTLMTVAQALPKFCESIRAMAANPDTMDIVKKTGSLLHGEESLLSDQEEKELGMIQDMKGAMDHIRKNATVKFGGEESVDIDKKTGKITITLCVPNSGISADQSFKITAPFFTQGVNEWQSIGHALGWESRQDDINLEALGQLMEYAEKAEKLDLKEIQALKAHYSHENAKNRMGKDVKGVELIHAAVKALGGNIGVVCKSGKDRTGLETLRRLATAVAAKVGGGFTEIFNGLSEGNSYLTTRRSTGALGYAFNPGQMASFPEAWRLLKRLCGNSDS